MIKCDPRAKARCPFKNPCCGDEVAYFVEGSECDKFNQQVLAPPPTNADRIRAMSDEELAQWMASKIANQKFLDIAEKGIVLTAAQKTALYRALYVPWLAYLQQPAEEADL